MTKSLGNCKINLLNKREVVFMGLKSKFTTLGDLINKISKSLEPKEKTEKEKKKSKVNAETNKGTEAGKTNKTKETKKESLKQRLKEKLTEGKRKKAAKKEREAAENKRIDARIKKDAEADVFLNGVVKIGDFEVFKAVNDMHCGNIYSVYDEYYEKVKEKAEKLEKTLSKTKNILKDHNKIVDEKIVLSLMGACYNLIAYLKAYEREKNSDKSRFFDHTFIDFKELQGAFATAADSSDENSFLSDEKVKKYMSTQANKFAETIKVLEEVEDKRQNFWEKKIKDASKEGYYYNLFKLSARESDVIGTLEVPDNTIERCANNYISGSLCVDVSRFCNALGADLEDDKNKDLPGNEYLVAIQKACIEVIKVGMSSDDEKKKIRKAITACENLKGAFEKAISSKYFKKEGGNPYLCSPAASYSFGTSVNFLDNSIFGMRALLWKGDRRTKATRGRNGKIVIGGNRNKKVETEKKSSEKAEGARVTSEAKEAEAVKAAKAKEKVTEFLTVVGKHNFKEFIEGLTLSNIYTVLEGYYYNNIAKTAYDLNLALGGKLGKGYYDEKSENCLSKIKEACDVLYQEIKKSENEKDITNKRHPFFVTIPRAYENLQKAFAAAVGLSQSDKTLFLSNEAVKNYMATQAGTLSKSMNKLNSGLEDVKKESNESKTIKAKEFLKSIEDGEVYFDVFPSTKGFNFIQCCNYLYRGGSQIVSEQTAPKQAVSKSEPEIKGTLAIATKLKELISTMLGKEEFKNDTGKGYLEAIGTACSKFLTVSGSNKNIPYNPSDGINAYEGISNAFKAIYEFSSKKDDTESALSFLSNADVKNYLKQQSEALEESLNNLRTVSQRR